MNTLFFTFPIYSSIWWHCFFPLFFGENVDVLLWLVADIAYLKEALRTWKGVKSPKTVFVAACKEGRKPEFAQVKSAVKGWFEWARKQKIVIAMPGETVYTRLG